MNIGIEPMKKSYHRIIKLKNKKIEIKAKE